MAFEKFVKTTRSCKAKLSLRYNGTIHLNSAAVLKFDLLKYRHATLYFDKDTNSIGVKPTLEPEEGSHRFDVSKSGAIICATHFLRHYGLSTGHTKIFEAAWDLEHGMVVASCSKTTS
jgi:hypothetical protein